MRSPIGDESPCAQSGRVPKFRDRDALPILVAEATAKDLTARLAAADGSLAARARAHRAFARGRPQGFRLMFAVEGGLESMARACEEPDATTLTPMPARPSRSCDATSAIHIASSTPWQRLERRAGGSRARDGVGAV